MGAPVGNLRVLDLSNNGLGDCGAESLAKCADLAGLLALDVSGAHIGNTGGEVLARSEHLNGLLHLDLSGNALSSAANSLRKRFGDRVVLSSAPSDIRYVSAGAV